MDILTTIAEYKHHLKAAGYAAATIANYRKYLDQFKRHLQELEVTDLRKVNLTPVQEIKKLMKQDKEDK